MDLDLMCKSSLYIYCCLWMPFKGCTDEESDKTHRLPNRQQRSEKEGVGMSVSRRES